MTRSCGCSVCTRSACRGAESCLLLSALLCRVPARRPGSFHLMGQMKVTKAKALNATPFMRSARCGTPAQRATWSERDTSDQQRTRRRGPRKASPAQSCWTPVQSATKPRRASCRFDWRRWLQVARRAGCARHEERTERFCIQPLCFGDFHLRPQMKVTRLPGRDPASGAVSQASRRHAQVRWPQWAVCRHRVAPTVHAPRVARSAVEPLT